MANLTGSIEANISGLSGGGSKTFNIPLANSSSPGYTDLVSLTTSITTLTIPSNTSWIFIEPPAGNTTNILIGDSGTLPTVAGTVAFAIPVPASSPVMKLSAASGTIANVQITYA